MFIASDSFVMFPIASDSVVAIWLLMTFSNQGE